MTSAPINPQRRLHRVIVLSRADSMVVLICAAGGIFFSAMQGNWVFAIFSALSGVAGLMERHGSRLLDDGDAAGLEWLPGAQGALFTVILGYAAWRWRFFEPAAYWAEIPKLAQEQISEQMRTGGLDPEKDREMLLRTMNGLVCFTLVAISMLYQGGLALWYRMQRRSVDLALQNPSTPPELPR